MISDLLGTDEILSLRVQVQGQMRSQGLRDTRRRNQVGRHLSTFYGISDPSTVVNTQEGEREKYGTLFALSDPEGSQDWALIKIEHPALLAFPRADEYMANNLNLCNKVVYPNSIATGSLDTDVLTCTGSGGTVQGRLSGVAAFKRAAGQKGFQQLVTMSLNIGSLRKL